MEIIDVKTGKMDIIKLRTTYADKTKDTLYLEDNLSMILRP